MTTIYEIFQNKDGQFRFWLIDGNGSRLLISKAYETRDACADAVASAKKNASALKRFECRQAEDGKRYFVLKAENDLPLGRSRLFASAENLDNAIETIRRHGPYSPVNDLTPGVS